jgi:U4/U6 small nuclear ribonucleoprotein PRP3
LAFSLSLSRPHVHLQLCADFFFFLVLYLVVGVPQYALTFILIM